AGGPKARPRTLALTPSHPLVQTGPSAVPTPPPAPRAATNPACNAAVKPQWRPNRISWIDAWDPATHGDDVDAAIATAVVDENHHGGSAEAGKGGVELPPPDRQAPR